MKLDNFLPVSRKLQTHWIYKDSSYLHCWLEMLFNARFSNEPKTDIYKGVLYTIERGEFIYSRPTYASRLGVSEGKLRTLIKLLVAENMIEEVKSLGNNKPTIYKIINYNSYNVQPSECVDFEGDEEHNNQVATKSQPSDNQVAAKSQPLKNNVKNEKKKDVYITCQHLTMTESEYNKLVDAYGKSEVDGKIEYCDNYAKLKNYKSLYKTVNNWLKIDVAKSKEQSDINSVRFIDDNPFNNRGAV